MAEKQMSRAEKEAREMIADMKMRKAATDAYNRADQTEPAPMARPSVQPRPARMPAQAMPQDQMGNATGMKKGGSVSASKRADGIAERGKTRCKVC